MKELTADFFSGRPTEQIAKDLLGVTLTRKMDDGVVGGVIVETEAYLGDQDTAAHAFGHRKSKANAALFSDPGTLYFYTMRGLILMNLICQPSGTPQGVLLRALEPTVGTRMMEQNRHRTGVDIANGPAKLTAAMGIGTLKYNDMLLSLSPFSLSISGQYQPQQIVSAARVGVSEGEWHDRQLRFYVEGNPYVSGMKKKEMDWDNHGWTND
ncbi:MAG: DNA-3-methyladenine glycosylase [Furfurilactobacillus sp.]|jgi:DNA-3-methyladenine glycosylase|uniref:Putative 3-methyladenine DNA glycosylase n=1 Tax=Furfurilactobacillus milii TaxID=2888272 RepID=A0ABT6D9G4_9LACO|nr:MULTISPECIES: DNA-3-methyladenine glycosylase [Furfurilactobacillus]QLE66141.1 DNA-3-methyladenine glycosylase II [Furfurilactobacillus rossiae]MCF6160761.1 DNA-3-methyladenine glycosylase [Furfurilactobacillus milii]MCF6163045.1 DNA-3-methyladenine glycosylase [Furfurilactobacillus milii]MCF6419754.1 DNA-3-methyladenine glycosylase [Furfurilactobacillus milii]MCH4012658.1 DNA-3-methyladenine glycosylase [Furfurilactobacillus sp.]